jgi:hypothetical protein
MPNCPARVVFGSPRIDLSANEPCHFERGQSMAFLALGDLGVAIGGHVAHDDRHVAIACSNRCAQSLGAEVHAVPALAIRATQNERLRDTAMLRAV